MPLKTSGAMNDEIVVGYSYEVENIINKLIRGSIEMYIVPIIRIPRIGGTTLAKKEYNDPSVTFHFHILVWYCLSGLSQKKLLLDIHYDIVELTNGNP